jgi:hypothetical protein
MPLSAFIATDPLKRGIEPVAAVIQRPDRNPVRYRSRMGRQIRGLHIVEIGLKRFLLDR